MQISWLFTAYSPFHLRQFWFCCLFPYLYRVGCFESFLRQKTKPEGQQITLNRFLNSSSNDGTILKKNSRFLSHITPCSTTFTTTATHFLIGQSSQPCFLRWRLLLKMRPPFTGHFWLELTSRTRAYSQLHAGISKSFRTESITK